MDGARLSEWGSGSFFFFLCAPAFIGFWFHIPLHGRHGVGRLNQRGTGRWM